MLFLKLFFSLTATACNIDLRIVVSFEKLRYNVCQFLFIIDR